MKKIISSILATAVMLTATSIFAYANTCSHSYIEKVIPKTCTAREKTIYTCSLCGDTYESEAALYTAPEAFYTAIESKVSGDLLTITASIYNNPGIYGSIIKIGYNSEALVPIALTNGNVWSSTENALTTTTTYIKQFGEAKESANNYKNGIVFSGEFKILKPYTEWGISVKCNPWDFVNIDNQKNDIVVINTAAAGYGEHSWDSGVCTTPPTVFEEGETLYSCTLCPAKHTEVIPILPRYKKGDINNNGKFDMADLISLKLYIKGLKTLTAQQTDAADINSDGKSNLLDIIRFKLLFKNLITD